MPTIINGNTGIDQVTNNTLVVADAKSGETVGFQKMQLFAAQATTSGTNIDITGIPSWAKKITITLHGVSTNGVNSLLIQQGTSSGIATSGYSGSSTTLGLNTIASSAAVAGLSLDMGSGNTAAATRHGTVVLTKVSNNNWVSSGFIHGTAGYGCIADNSIALAGELDRIRLTTVNGTDTFDAGSVSILVEGYA